jgi:Leu/Phe-tRNA-protein transferase
LILDLTESGHLFVSASGKESGMGNSSLGDELIDRILHYHYDKEFILSCSFEADFVADLMHAGFLVMSMGVENQGKTNYILMPKHHTIRTVLLFDKLRISKSVRRLLPHYELRADTDYEKIVASCVDTHGSDWLTPPLLCCLQEIREMENAPVRPYSFALYKNNKLVAGEFGILCGRVYTSYSGYYAENSCGTVQMILCAQYLQKKGFPFWDLGMPLDYKYRLGAQDINSVEFISLFRAGRA